MRAECHEPRNTDNELEAGPRTAVHDGAVADGGSNAREHANHNEGRSAVAGMKEFANLFYCVGALDSKTAQLVALAAMAAAGCTS